MTAIALQKIVEQRRVAMLEQGDRALYSDLVENKMLDLLIHARVLRPKWYELKALALVLGYLETERTHHETNPSADHIWHQIVIVRQFFQRLNAATQENEKDQSNVTRPKSSEDGPWTDSLLK